MLFKPFVALGLGDGSTISETATPQTVSGLVATKIACGYNHVCALLPNGSVKCWGSNMESQIGDGVADTPRRSPSLVAF